MQLDIKVAELEDHLRLLDAGEYLQSMDPIHHQRMKLLLHLPETAIQEQSTSEEDEEEFVEFLEQNNKRTLQRNDSGRHSLDSRTTEETSENVSIWYHEAEKPQWKPMICNTDLQQRHHHSIGANDYRTSSRFSFKKCHTISTEEEDEECDLQGRAFSNSNKPCSCDDPDCEDTGCCADDVRSSSDDDQQGEMEAVGLLLPSSGVVLNKSPDVDNRELEANNSASCNAGCDETEGDGKDGVEEDKSEVDRLVVEMQDVQMRLLQLNGKSHMIYYV